MALTEETINSISSNYYSFVNRFSRSKYEDEKMLGKFYTNQFVCSSLSASVVLALKQVHKKQICIIDPFCGDGRLVVSLMEEISKDSQLRSLSFSLFLWDIDNEAVTQAQANVSTFVGRAGLKASIIAEMHDAFSFARSFYGRFDVCITNPPWALLKPQKIFSDVSSEEIENYKRVISKYDEFMKQEFSTSLPEKKFGKWGTNLSRCGTELSIKLLCDGGICGLVSPATFLNDQVSRPLRQWMFSLCDIRRVDYYPSELKLFGKADVESVTVLFLKGSPQRRVLIVRHLETTPNSETIEGKDFDFVEKQGFVLPLSEDSRTLHVLERLNRLPSLSDYCVANSLKVTREIDETNISEKLAPTGTIRFVKGYMIGRYSFTTQELFLKADEKDAPKSVHFPKIVWRDVSRRSQQRRVQATYLPKNCIAGNSLGVVASNSGQGPALYSLLGFLGSLVFEYQARVLLTSNHVPAGVIRKVKIPFLDVNNRLASLVAQRLGSTNCEYELDAYVAKLYGLDFDCYSLIVSSFGFNSMEEQQYLSAFRTESKKEKQ